MSHYPSLNQQPVYQTGSRPDMKGRFFAGQQDLPQFSGGWTRQRGESAGWASPPAQTPLGHVLELQGGGWARRTAYGAVYCCLCLQWPRQLAPEPSAEWTKTTAELPGWAESARRAPRWIWSRPSWVALFPQPVKSVFEFLMRLRPTMGVTAASLIHLAGFWLVSSARLRYGRLFPLRA